MARTREVIKELANEGVAEVHQNWQKADITPLKGLIRLRMANT